MIAEVRTANRLCIRRHPSNLIRRHGHCPIRSNGPCPVSSDSKHVDSYGFFVLKAHKKVGILKGVRDVVTVEMR